MRYLFLLLFLIGCSIKAPCPPQDVYFPILHEDGVPKIIQMDKGYLDERGNWKSEDEMIEWYQQRNELIND